MGREWGTRGGGLEEGDERGRTRGGGRDQRGGDKREGQEEGGTRGGGDGGREDERG